MSLHYIHRYKYSHDKRRKQVNHMLATGKAVIRERCAAGDLVEITPDHRVSNRGNLVPIKREEKSHAD